MVGRSVWGSPTGMWDPPIHPSVCSSVSEYRTLNPPIKCSDQRNMLAAARHCTALQQSLFPDTANEAAAAGDVLFLLLVFLLRVETNQLHCIVPVLHFVMYCERESSTPIYI